MCKREEVVALTLSLLLLFISLLTFLLAVQHLKIHKSRKTDFLIALESVFIFLTRKRPSNDAVEEVVEMTRLRLIVSN